MTLEMIALWVLAGALAGLLAGFLMKRGSPGLTVDIPLGLVGSMVGSWIFLGFSAEAGLVAVAVVAFVGAAIVIVVQRRFWPALG
jgi:uncharacterized membrane protein YeaQ/YmgE (transglycosylase-associated protein family)